MNPVSKLQYKTKVGILLGALLALLLVNNIAGQQSLTNMQKDANSIYEDRLMPSTFLFDIREALYQERIILGSGATPAAMADMLQTHRVNIASLVSRYEKTVLTPEERKEWTAMKTHLRAFHEAPPLTPEVNTQFEMVLKDLNNLKAIQAGEGAYLQKDLTKLGANILFGAYIEKVLLIVMGAVTVMLIGGSRNVFEKTVSHRPTLN